MDCILFGKVNDFSPSISKRLFPPFAKRGDKKFKKESPFVKPEVGEDVYFSSGPFQLKMMIRNLLHSLGTYEVGKVHLTLL